MRSIIQYDGTMCFLCRIAVATDTHHIYGGPNRSRSEEDGEVVRLCRPCHNAVHAGKHSGELQKKLHQLGQVKWEMVYGTREEFLKRYGRNYL